MLAEDRGLSKLLRKVVPHSTRPEQTPHWQSQSSLAGQEKHAQLGEDIEHATWLYSVPKSRPSSRRGSWVGLLFAAVVISVSTALWSHRFTGMGVEAIFTPSLKGACPQQAAIPPQEHAELLDGVEKLFTTEGFKSEAFESLGGAVRIPYVFDAS